MEKKQESIKLVNELFGEGFKLLYGLPESLVIEQQAHPGLGLNWGDKVRMFVQMASRFGAKRAGFMFEKETADEASIVEALLKSGFKHFSSSVEVYKDLLDLPMPEVSLDWLSLDSSGLADEEFKKYWGQSMSFSANQQSALSMDEHLQSVKAELGESWRSACRVFFEKDTPIGVTIPHIEPGTYEEGRLFYFGILPEARGRGLGPVLHAQFLYMLMGLGASYYVGSTHQANREMQKVFLKNGCTVKRNTESYYIYF
ncbi:GNAT family N-acetyltransferase [Bacillus sp. EB01]|uniref:GNAT family N-acetyltransferase n=1 Tax=Bacillus sp. EB01 TaxID=1347086 RepID=UPI0005C64A5B|nr:GNAT family N-acetyltransferase [Bacillus sp. EB01]